MLPEGVFPELGEVWASANRRYLYTVTTIDRGNPERSIFCSAFNAVTGNEQGPADRVVFDYRGRWVNAGDYRDNDMDLRVPIATGARATPPPVQPQRAEPTARPNPNPLAINGFTVLIGERWVMRNGGIAVISVVSTTRGLTNPIEARMLDDPEMIGQYTFSRDGIFVNANMQPTQYDLLHPVGENIARAPIAVQSDMPDYIHTTVPEAEIVVITQPTDASSPTPAMAAATEAPQGRRKKKKETPEAVAVPPPVPPPTPVQSNQPTTIDFSKLDEAEVVRLLDNMLYFKTGAGLVPVATMVGSMLELPEFAESRMIYGEHRAPESTRFVATECVTLHRIVQGRTESISIFQLPFIPYNAWFSMRDNGRWKVYASAGTNSDRIKGSGILTEDYLRGKIYVILTPEGVFVARRRNDGSLKSMPLTNFWEDGRSCMGGDTDNSKLYMIAPELALEHLLNAEYNSDLMHDGKRAFLDAIQWRIADPNSGDKGVFYPESLRADEGLLERASRNFRTAYGQMASAIIDGLRSDLIWKTDCRIGGLNSSPFTTEQLRTIARNAKRPDLASRTGTIVRRITERVNI